MEYRHVHEIQQNLIFVLLDFQILCCYTISSLAAVCFNSRLNFFSNRTPRKYIARLFARSNPKCMKHIHSGADVHAEIRP